MMQRAMGEITKVPACACRDQRKGSGSWRCESIEGWDSSSTACAPACAIKKRAALLHSTSRVTPQLYALVGENSMGLSVL